MGAVLLWLTYRKFMIMITIKVQGRDSACIPDQLHNYNNNNIYTNIESIRKLFNKDLKLCIDLAFTALEGKLFQSLIILLK